MSALKFGSTGRRIADRSELDDLVVVRRNVWLSAVVGGLAALLGVGYLLSGSSALETLVGVLLLVLAALHGVSLGSARTPVLVADEHGIRLRIGLAWRGLPWGAIRQVVVDRADVPVRESRLVIVPRDPATTTDYLTLLGRLHLRWNRLWYGAPLSLPLGITTVTDRADLVGDLTALADGRTDVVQLRGPQRAHLDEVVPLVRPDVETAPEEAPEEAPDDVPAAAAPPVDPVRPLHRPSRVEVRLENPALSNLEPESHASVPTQRRPGELDLDAGHDDDVPAREDTVEVVVPDLSHAEAWEEVRPEIAADDLSVTTPEDRAPADPVIGPRIAHAREMLDMSIDELSDRTRIRPHVLEAMEVDDFGPCGGDFYSRGHLTTIARVLGLTLEPLMQEYDARYAGGPINARRVFEAELATGLSSGMRATRGGTQWTLLVGAVLCLTLVWGVARLLAGEPAQVAAPPTTSGDSAGLAANRQPITSPLMKTTPMTVTAAHAGAHVVVRDRTGRILWSGDLRMTHHRKVVGLAPFKVSSDNAGAIEVTVAGEPRGTLGTAGEAGSKRFG